MAGKFSFGETEVCNMHVHVLFCRRRIALLFPNPTSASLAIPRVRVATTINSTYSAFYTKWLAPKFGYARGMKWDMPAQLVHRIAFLSFMASWSQFSHHQSWKPRTSKYLCHIFMLEFLDIYTFYV